MTKYNPEDSIQKAAYNTDLVTEDQASKFTSLYQVQALMLGTNYPLALEFLSNIQIDALRLGILPEEAVYLSEDEIEEAYLSSCSFENESDEEDSSLVEVNYVSLVSDSKEVDEQDYGVDLRIIGIEALLYS
ncbi:MAG: hypothetical protein WBJ81_04615 [Rickettsiales bacterium]